MSFVVTVGFDEGERRYYVIESDIPGLNIEADTFEEFVEYTMDFVPDLVGEAAVGAKVTFQREVVVA
jgi:hypothetical protein